MATWISRSAASADRRSGLSRVRATEQVTLAALDLAHEPERFRGQEYIFDLENVMVVETPQFGHATYLFPKPADMSRFLVVYAGVTKEDIRQNRDNVAERLGFLGHLIHGANPRAWLKELRACLGEVVDYADAVATEPS